MKSELDVVARTAIGVDAPAWDAIASTVPRSSPFLRSWWIDSVLGVGIDRPLILMVHHDGELVGGLALESVEGRSIARIRPAGADLGPDHIDVVARPERLDEVLDAIRAWIRRSGSATFDLSGVDVTSRLASALPGPVIRTTGEVAPWALLPDRFSDYWADRTSTLRNTVERTGRRFEREGVEYESGARVPVQEGFADFWRLHQLRWAGRSSLTGTEARLERVVQAGCEAGAVVLHRLVVDGGCIAIELWFEVGRVASFYQSARDPDHRWRGSGSVLKARAIENAMSRGVEAIDLLRGDEPYKREWVDRTRPLVRLRAAHGLAGYATLGRSLLAGRLSRFRPGAGPGAQGG